MAATLLLVFAAIWFAYIAPPKVAVMTFGMLFIVSLTIRTLTFRIAGEQVSYITALKAAAASVLLFVIAGFLLGGLLSPNAGGFRFLAVGSPVPWLPPIVLLLAFIGGFHLCLPTSFRGSAIVALASTVISVAAFYLLRGIFQ